MSTSSYSPFVHLDRVVDSGQVMQILRSARYSGALALVYSVGSQRHVFTSGTGNEFSADSRVDIGCIIKNITTLVTAVAVSEGRLALEDSVDRFFPDIEGIDTTLKVCHLLNHSHGLDGSAISRSVFDPDGWIDSAGLWGALVSSPPIAPPGAMFYYYGISGFWLAVAILERLYETKFATLIEEWILPHINVHRRPGGLNGICPATGGLTLSANELVNLGNLHLQSSGNADLDQAICDLRLKNKVSMLQWPPIAEGATPGWFAYPGDTFGMFGRSTIASTFFLISPADNAIIALSGSSEYVVTLVRRALVGSLVGEHEPRPPRLLTRAERSTRTFEQYVGRYGKAKLVLVVQRNSQGEIVASVHGRRSAEVEMEDSPVVSRLLVPGADDTFFPAPPERSTMPYIKFVGEGADGMYEYALTGKHVFRRFSP